MAVIAKWGNKKWEISSKKLNPVNEISIDMGYNTDEKRKEKRTVKVPYKVYKEFGVDVENEINSWYEELGKAAGLYIGSKRFGPKLLKLTNVSASAIQATDTGVIRSAEFSLDFEEV